MTLMLGTPAQFFGLFDRYPAETFGMMAVPIVLGLTLAFRLDRMEKSFGLVCSKCGLHLSRAAASKVWATGCCPRCNLQILDE